MLELQQRRKALTAGIFEAGGNTAAALDAAEIEPLLPCHRQAADAGNGLDQAVGPDPIGHDDGEQQQTD